MATATIGTSYEHIALDEDELPWIVGANTKVVELVSEVMPTAGAVRSFTSSTPT